MYPVPLAKCQLKVFGISLYLMIYLDQLYSLLFLPKENSREERGLISLEAVFNLSTNEVSHFYITLYLYIK